MPPIEHLPLREFGLTNIPAIPIKFSFLEPASTFGRLLKRKAESAPAKLALSNKYTIGGKTGTGFDFLFNSNFIEEVREAIEAVGFELLNDARRLRAFRSLYDPKVPEILGDRSVRRLGNEMKQLPLDNAEQFSISWTNLNNVYVNALPLLPAWAATLTDRQAATDQFWPEIANSGFAYNLILPEKLNDGRANELAAKFGQAWVDEGLGAVHAAGRLYAIDMSLFETLKPQTIDGFERFTPATITLMEQDAASKKLSPKAILCWGAGNTQVYTRASNAWLYALQAAKTSVTVYGIWIGHVYHWHIVTAATQMAMFNTLPASHVLAQLLQPQSGSLIEFDEVLLLLWRFIAPPTSVSTAPQFLELCNTFANGRGYYDDDPRQTIARLRLDQAQFTQVTPWDLYPVVQRLLQIWDATEIYVNAVVDGSYLNDAAVKADGPLQTWMIAAADPNEGNVQGIGAMDSKASLKKMLTSLIYRITAHGISAMNISANPVLTFVANFPPCLQNSQLPNPNVNMSTVDLLKYLPNTGAIGDLVSFFYVFIYAKPYTRLIPKGGVTANLFFGGGQSDPRNQALIHYRSTMVGFINTYTNDATQVSQWPIDVET